MSEAPSSVTGMAPLPGLIRSAGLTRVTIIKNYGTDDEERVEVEAQLLNSKEAYFAIEDPLNEGDHVEMPDHRGGTTVKTAAKVVQHHMPANMRSGSGGSDDMTEVRWGEAEPVRRAPVRRLDLQRLHPQVISAASALFADRQYDSAVTEAMKSVEVRVRDLTRLSISGAALMQEAFKPKEPRLDVAVETGRSGDDEREATSTCSGARWSAFATPRLTSCLGATTQTRRWRRWRRWRSPACYTGGWTSQRSGLTRSASWRPTRDVGARRSDRAESYPGERRRVCDPR